MRAQPLTLAIIVSVTPSTCCHLTVSVQTSSPGFARRMAEGDLPPHMHSLGITDSKSAIDSRLAQLFHRGLGSDGRIVHLLKGVRSRFGRQDWKDFNMPVVVVVNRLPVAEILGGMQATRRSVQHEMKFLCNGADALQGAAQKSG